MSEFGGFDRSAQDRIFKALRKPGVGGSSLEANETPKAWSFKDSSVAEKFDEHVREQLPWYDPLSRFIAEVAVSFIPQNGVVYDIGASTGNMQRLLAPSLAAKKARIVSVEPSHEMAAIFSKSASGRDELLVIDAERVFLNDSPDVVIMFLMLMFMTPAAREPFLERVIASVKPGGAIIIVDKGYLESRYAQVACKAAQLAEKKRSGASGDSYVAKELSLRGEQRPTDMGRLFDLFLREDWDVSEIFRFGEFYGTLAVKRAL